MTGHVVSFEPAGAPTRAVCECGWRSRRHVLSALTEVAEAHLWLRRHVEGGRIEFAGLPPVERAS